jgi:hypothetical protein
MIIARKRPVAVGFAVLALGACSADSSGPNAKGTIGPDSGGGQTADVTSQLTPYRVKVLDSSGQPRSGVVVTWSVAGGGGSVVPPSSVTDAAGLAEATATLGTAAGAQTVRASARGYSGSPVAFTSTGTPGPAALIGVQSGDHQIGAKGTTLAQNLKARVTDVHGNPVPNATVNWSVTAGGGTLSADSSSTDDGGIASVTWTMGPSAGTATVSAALPGGPAVTFSATVATSFAIRAGGNNVPERYSSDLWIAGGYGYTGTWNWVQRQAGVAGVIKVFQLDGTGAPSLVDSVRLANVTTVSDLEVSPDSQWLLATAEGGTAQGIYVYSLSNPAKPTQAGFTSVSGGLHTGSLSVIGGKLYAFTAKNPVGTSCSGAAAAQLIIFDLSDISNHNIATASSTNIPCTYGIHDTFVRDGICFAFVWNEGVYIYDVGNGIQAGSPTAPVKVGGLKTAGGEAHNGWWFWNPNGEKRYLFVGQEGPGTVGTSSSGDIHVVDVSNLAAPVEVATYSMAGAGTHNFWMDEQNQRLYAAYYNGGVVALDVSGTLSGNLASREISRFRPGGVGNTYTWGVMLAGGSLYAIDMLSGLWQLSAP